MGNHLGLKQSDIKFVQILEDPNFGTIDIYKNQTGKHVMMLRRTFIKNGDDRMLHDFTEMLQYAQDNQGLDSKRVFQQGDIVTPILFVSKNIENNLCIAYEIYDTYCQYFNFTFHDMIKCRKEMEIDELWLCYHWLLQLAIFLQKKNWTLQKGITPNSIFITLKGRPTISIHHLYKIRQDDIFLEENSFLNKNNDQKLKQIGLCILQLFCQTDISQTENCQLYLRKLQKADEKLGRIIGKLLRKNISKTASSQITLQNLLHQFQQLFQNQEIVVSRQIKLNKFRYVIPKINEKKSQKCQEEKQNKNKNFKKMMFFKEEQTKEQDQETNKQKHFKSTISHHTSTKNQNNQEEQKIVINSLQGRKNKAYSQYTSMRQSQKKNILFKLDQNISNNGNLRSNFLANEIESKKLENERKREKLAERKQFLLKGSLQTNTESFQKQNMLENSISKLKTNKPSWSRRAVNNHLQSNKVKNNK